MIGLEPYPPWHIMPVLPHALYAPLTEQFPQATFKPVWFSLLRRIIRNSEEELALVRHVAASVIEPHTSMSTINSRSFRDVGVC